jgi:hypothetical protein
VNRPEATGRRIATSSGGPPAPDSVSAWLDVMVSMLNLPPGERAEVREELESHLRDRVRDLMLGGLDSEEAMARAVGELGDAAELAGRFGVVKRAQRRRTVMNVLGLGVAAGAAVVSIAALMNSGGSTSPAGPGAAATPATPAVAVGEGEVATLREKVREQQATIADLRRQVEAAKVRAMNEPFPVPPYVADPVATGQVDWRKISRQPAEQAIRVLAEALKLEVEILEPFPQDAVAWDGNPVPPDASEPLFRPAQHVFSAINPSRVYRVRDGVLQVASVEYFRREEMKVRAYDLSALAAVPGFSSSALIGTLFTLVNGPNSPARPEGPGQFNVVGSTLFVTGGDWVRLPTEWVLRQVGANAVPIVSDQAQSQPQPLPTPSREEN